MSDEFANEILDSLQKNGSRLSKPHEFSFFVEVPVKENALKVEEKCKLSGFHAKTSRSGRRWMVTASKVITPATANLDDYGRFFKQLANAVNGVFDGWEAEVVEM